MATNIITIQSSCTMSCQEKINETNLRKGQTPSNLYQCFVFINLGKIQKVLDIYHQS